MVAGLSDWVGGLRVGGVPARDQYDCLSEDERLGAIVEDYRDWDFIVHLNLYEKGGRPPFKKRVLSRNPLIRWLIAGDRWGFLAWSWSVQGPKGQVCTSSEHSRRSAVKAAKDCIDKYLTEGKFS